jgi:hypothetical protein
VLVLRASLAVLPLVLTTRADFAIENLALRQQINAIRRRTTGGQPPRTRPPWPPGSCIAFADREMVCFGRSCTASVYRALPRIVLIFQWLQRSVLRTIMAGRWSGRAHDA